MKHVGILWIVMAAIGIGSCSRGSKSELKTEVDSLSYFFGYSRTDGIMGYLTLQVGVDTAYLDEFMKGFKKGAVDYSPEDIAYLEGVRIAQMINNEWIPGLNNTVFMGDSGKTVNREAVLAGFYHGVKANDDLAAMKAQSYANAKIEELKARAKLEKSEDSQSVDSEGTK